jgi:L-threonylcarbamoyladenylate synthase
LAQIERVVVAAGVTAALTDKDAETFSRCIAVGGVAGVPGRPVYGLACEPDLDEAVRRLYALKGRRPDKPAAVMFFQPTSRSPRCPSCPPRRARPCARSRRAA